MTDRQQFVNNFSATLQTSINDTETTINIGTTNAALLGTLSGNDFFILTLVDSSVSRPTINQVEIVKVTAVNTGTGDLTVVRGYEGTAAKIWTSGTTLVYCSFTALTANDLQTQYSYIYNYSGTALLVNSSLRSHVVACTNAGGTVTITLPTTATESLPAGFRVDFVQRGTSGLSFAVEGGDTTESIGGSTTSGAQYGIVTAIKLVNSTNNIWGLFGDLT